MRRTCPRCRDADRAPGRGYCDPCNAARTRAWRAANPEGDRVIQQRSRARRREVETRPGTRSRQPWTEVEDQLVLANRATTRQELARVLQRSVRAVDQRRHVLASRVRTGETPPSR